MAVALLVLVTRAQQDFLPSGLATEVGHKQRGVPLRHARRGRNPDPQDAGAHAATADRDGELRCLFVALGLALRASELPATLTTLNEPIIGAGFLLFYMCLPRSRTTALVCAASVTLCIVVLVDRTFVIDQAESLVPLVLAGPAIDIFDRRLLNGDASGTRALWMTWVVALTLVAIVLIPVGAWARDDLSGGGAVTIDYLRRAIEGYWGWVFVHVYFAFLLGVAWRNSRSGRRAARETTPRVPRRRER